jgi:hypothetical protein
MRAALSNALRSTFHGSASAGFPSGVAMSQNMRAAGSTVPRQGRIWKVESIVYSQGVTHCPTSSNYINISDSIMLDGKGTMVRAQRFSGLHPGWSSQAFSPEFIVWEQKLPMWLPSGTRVAAGRGVMYLSVLEFKKTP